MVRGEMYGFWIFFEDKSNKTFFFFFFFFFFVAAKAFVVVCMDSRPHAVSRSVVGVHSLSFPSREASLLWKEDS